MSVHSNKNYIAELERIRQTLRTIETDNPPVSQRIESDVTDVLTGYQKSALVARHNELVDELWAWKLHTVRRYDPAVYFPVEIVDLIFSFVVSYIVDLESEGPSWQGILASPKIIAGCRDGPLILTSVSRAWCAIATKHPPLWSTIFIDQSEGDYLERFRLFLDCSGKEPLEVILLDHIAPTPHFKDLLMEQAHRFKTFVGVDSVGSTFPFHNQAPTARLEPPETPATFVNWRVRTLKYQRASKVPIPICLRTVQLHQWQFIPRSLIQLTYFHTLIYLSIPIAPEPNTTELYKTLRFELLRHLHLRVSNGHWPTEYILESPWVEWLECPALEDLYLFYRLNQYPSKEMYPCLETWLLRTRSLRKLRIHMQVNDKISRDPDAGEFQNLQSSTFNGSLELVHFMFDVYQLQETAWMRAFVERIFSVFVPSTHLLWQYAQCPSPIIFTNLKSMHIQHWMDWDLSVLVARGMTKLEFPFLEELYLEWGRGEPEWMNILHAPRLISLRIGDLIPSDLRHITKSTISCIRMRFGAHSPGPEGIYLPSADKLQLDLEIGHLFHLNVHPSQTQALTINTRWKEGLLCPPHWTANYVSETLGTITDLNMTCKGSYLKEGFLYPSPTILSFLKPFLYLKGLTLLWERFTGSYINQFAQHLADPNFLPELEVLSITEYPSWPEFFQIIQKRQVGFLSGQFQTALKEITIIGGVHGALLGYLRESLAGQYLGRFDMPPRRAGSEEWPMQPIVYKELHTDGLLCCYGCYQAGLEIGCTISPSKNPRDMLLCDRLKADSRNLNTVYAPDMFRPTMHLL